MKIPEIDPELHGLLDEVVTDPRSALRRTPRRALLEWFGNPDSAHARPVDATTAERHLVAVYRESLAEMLLRASWLALHLQAVPRISPCRADGNRVDRDQETKRLQVAATRVKVLGYEAARFPAAVALIEAWAGTLDPDQSATLAELAVALVPSEFGKVRFATALPSSSHCEAIRILQQVANCASAAFVRKDAHNGLAMRMVDLGWLHLARDEYRRAIDDAPASPEAIIYSFNLACWAGDRQEALERSEQLEHVCDIRDVRLQEGAAVLRRWTTSCDLRVLTSVRTHVRRLKHEVSEPCLHLIGAYA